MSNVCYAATDIEAGVRVPIKFSFVNTGNMALTNIQLTWSSTAFVIGSKHQTMALLDTNTSQQVFNTLGVLDSANPNNNILHLHVSGKADGADYVFDRDIIVPIGTIRYYSSFSDSVGWIGSPFWQIVTDTDAEYFGALSCRPSVCGTFSLRSPDFVYTPNQLISFNYRYKMPMYGKDGLFVKLVSANHTQTLIFLGSGGALDADKTGEYYVDGKWCSYKLNLDDILLNQMTLGDIYHISFEFVRDDSTSTINHYSEMPDIGVFLQSFYLGGNDYTGPDGVLITDMPAVKINAYPNPVHSQNTMKIDMFSRFAGNYTVDIYNLKGQKVRQFHGNLTDWSFKRLTWDGKNENGHAVATGVYFLKMHVAGKTQTKKILILK
jgi:hypothetical protein